MPQPEHVTTKEALDRVFKPRSVVIAGDGPRQLREAIFNALVAFGFRGNIHSVSRQAEEVSDRKAYRSIAKIPGPVDYVVCCASAAEMLPLLTECAAKQVGAVSILTSVNAKGSASQYTRLEPEVSAIIRETGLRVIGPAGMEVYCPQGGMTFDPRLPIHSGRMGFICQGREAFVHVTKVAGQRGVRFSKAVSSPNFPGFPDSELLEYFAQDADTDAVAVFIESVADGTRFFRALRSLSTAKPVILLKTSPGSDGRDGTGSVRAGGPGSDQAWQALLRQTGAVGVNRAEEMVEAMVAFSMLARPRGRRVGIFGAAGGASVLATDAWADAGFVLPPVPPQLRTLMDAAALNEAGMMLQNPLDFSMAGYTDFFFDVVKKLVAHEDFVDLSVIHNPSGQGAWMPWPFFDRLIDTIAGAVIRIHREVPAPMVLVMHYIHTRRHWQKILDDLQAPCAEAGVPVFYSMTSAARAIDRMLRYYEARAASSEGY